MKTIEEKAHMSDGRSTRCDGCRYSKFMFVPDSFCQICTSSYVEGYRKGYSQSTTDRRTRRQKGQIVANTLRGMKRNKPAIRVEVG